MRRLAALFLLALLLPAAAAAEKTEERVAQGIESVIDGMDFAAVEDVTLDVPGWPEHRTLEQTVQALAGGEGFSADDVLTAALGIFMREVGALVGPLLRTLAVVFMLRLSAALLEPIADGDIVCAIGDFSRTVVLFFITMLCVGTMYFLLIVQVLLVGNLTVLLR